MTRSLSRSDWLAWGAVVAATVGWTFWAGKELGWDVLNHHLYLPFSMVSGRAPTDLYGAGPQSFQNPLGYLPGYAMIVALGWPAWLVGSVFAVAHAVCAIVVFRIAQRLWSGDPNEFSGAVLATVMAWVTPAYLVVAGTTSIDPTTALFVLCALALTVGHAQSLQTVHATGAGLLLGLAFACKQSNAVFLLAIGAVVVWRSLFGQVRARGVLGFALGSVGGAVLAMGWWSSMLWQRFRNPIYPLFNNIFESPYASTQAILASRFQPQGALDYLTRLFETVRPKQFIWVEAALPDVRLVLLGVAALALLIVFVGRRPSSLTWAGLRSQLGTMDAQIAVFALVAYVLWMKTSGNARYAVPLLMVAGLLLARATWSLLPLKPARSLLVVVAALQFAYFIDVGNVRYMPAKWDARPYLSVNVPARLVREPFLHLSLSLNSHASIAPFLNREGAMMSPIGQVSLPTEGKLGALVSAELQRWVGRTRILVPAPGTGQAVQFRNLISSMLYRLGLDVDWDDCLLIGLDHAEQGPTNQENASGHNLLSCMARTRVGKDPSYERERPIVDHVYQIIETSCPAIFGPPPGVSEHGVGKWQRFYANTDAIVTASFTDGVFVSHARSNIDHDIGTIDEVLAGKSHFKCQMWSLLAPD